MFSKEHIETLSRQEKHFTEAMSGYLRNTYRQDRQELRDCMAEGYPEVVYHYNDSCANCILNLYKLVAQRYWLDKAYWDAWVSEPDAAEPVQKNKKGRRATSK